MFCQGFPGSGQGCWAGDAGGGQAGGGGGGVILYPVNCVSAWWLLTELISSCDQGQCYNNIILYVSYHIFIILSVDMEMYNITEGLICQHNH